MRHINTKPILVLTIHGYMQLEKLLITEGPNKIFLHLVLVFLISIFFVSGEFYFEYLEKFIHDGKWKQGGK